MPWQTYTPPTSSKWSPSSPTTPGAVSGGTITGTGGGTISAPTSPTTVVTPVTVTPGAGGTVTSGSGTYSGTAVVPGVGGKTAFQLSQELRQQVVGMGGVTPQNVGYYYINATYPSSPIPNTNLNSNQQNQFKTITNVPNETITNVPNDIGMNYYGKPTSNIITSIPFIGLRAEQIATTKEQAPRVTLAGFTGQFFGTGTSTSSQPDPFGAISSLFRPIDYTTYKGTSQLIANPRYSSSGTSTIEQSQIPISSLIKEQIMVHPELTMTTEAFTYQKAEQASNLASNIVRKEYSGKISELQSNINSGTITYEEGTKAEETIRTGYEQKGQRLATDIFSKSMPEIQAQASGKATIQSIVTPSPITSNIALTAAFGGAYKIAPVTAGIISFGLGQVEGYKGISSGNPLQAGLGFGTSVLGQYTAVRGIANQINTAQIEYAMDKLRIGVDLRKTQGEYIRDIYSGVTTTGNTEIAVKGTTTTQITGQNSFNVIGGKFDLMGRTTEFYTGKDIFFGSGKIITGGKGILFDPVKGYTPGFAELKSSAGYDFSLMQIKSGFKGSGRTWVKPSSEFVGGLTSEVTPSGNQISYTGKLTSADIGYNVGNPKEVVDPLYYMQDLVNKGKLFGFGKVKGMNAEAAGMYYPNQNAIGISYNTAKKYNPLYLTDFDRTLAHEIIHAQTPKWIYSIEEKLKIPYRLQPSEMFARIAEQPYSLGFPGSTKPTFVARSDTSFSFLLSEKTMIKNVGYSSGVVNIGIEDISIVPGIRSNIPQTSVQIAKTGLITKVPSLIPSMQSAQTFQQGGQLFTKGSSILGLQSATLTATQQKQALSPALSKISIQRQSLMPVQQSIQPTIQELTVQQSLQTGQISRQALITPLTLQPITITPTVPITPFTPGFPPGLILPPYISMPSFNLGFGSTTGQKRKKGKQPTKYQPSLRAMFQGITSPKISKFSITGIGLRPIIRKKKRK